MKFAAGLFLLQGIALVVKACPGGYVPSHHILAVVNNPDLDDEIRQRANASYIQSQKILALRQQAGLNQAQNEGFIDAGDDDVFPTEQNPDDQAELEQEAETFQQLDQETPQPGTVERLRRFARRFTGGDMRGKLTPRQASGAPRDVFSDRSNSCVKNSPELILIRNGQSGPALDNIIETIYTNLGLVDALYRNVYGRNGIDNRGATYQSIGHYCYMLVNAYWDGVGMLFGDADNYMIRGNGFAEVLDVAGHEITHGVIQNSNPLYYYGQSGALNEHLADVFGALTTQYHRGQTVSQASWLLGETLVLPGNQPYRSMKAPGTAYSNANMGNGGHDDQVANMANLYTGPNDEGGVHINSGIPNRAFYLFATSLGPNTRAWQAAGQVWYNVLVGTQGQFNYQGETFRSFAQRTINEALRILGTTPAQRLERAWTSVGVL